MNYKKYDYLKLREQITDIGRRCPFISCESVGKSVMGRDIFCLRMGEGERKILVIGAHHSLEWISSAVLMNYVEDLSLCACDEKEFMGEDTAQLFGRAEFYIIPMLNPDGVDIVINKIRRKHPRYKEDRGGARSHRCEPHPARYPSG